MPARVGVDSYARTTACSRRSDTGRRRRRISSPAARFDVVAAADGRSRLRPAADQLPRRAVRVLLRRLPRGGQHRWACRGGGPEGLAFGGRRCAPWPRRQRRAGRSGSRDAGRGRRPPRGRHAGRLAGLLGEGGGRRRPRPRTRLTSRITATSRQTRKPSGSSSRSSTSRVLLRHGQRTPRRGRRRSRIDVSHRPSRCVHLKDCARPWDDPASGPASVPLGESMIPSTNARRLSRRARVHRARAAPGRRRRGRPGRHLRLLPPRTMSPSGALRPLGTPRARHGRRRRHRRGDRRRARGSRCHGRDPEPIRARTRQPSASAARPSAPTCATATSTGLRGRRRTARRGGSARRPRRAAAPCTPLRRRGDPLDDWDDTLEVNLTSVFALCRLAGAVMVPRGAGKIVTIASMLSFQGGFRAAVQRLEGRRGAAHEGPRERMGAARGPASAPDRARLQKTQLNRHIWHDDPEQAKPSLRGCPPGSGSRPQDLAGAAVFLVSDASDYVHGIVLPVDGGGGLAADTTDELVARRAAGRRDRRRRRCRPGARGRGRPSRGASGRDRPQPEPREPPTCPRRPSGSRRASRARRCRRLVHEARVSSAASTSWSATRRRSCGARS